MEREAKAYEEGQSLRAIAEAEGVSKSTVERDLQEKSPAKKHEYFPTKTEKKTVKD
jgi:DNA invertase Pin-like site-specific DNA recombinase